MKRMKLFRTGTTQEQKQVEPRAQKSDMRARVHIAVTRPHITEKTTAAKDTGNAYGFIVKNTATKPMIKHEIEKMYKVTVTHVNVVRMPRKVKRLGRSEGYAPGYKKALVYVKKGEVISFA